MPDNENLYVVTFLSRNKDNKDLKNFKQRNKSFLYNLPIDFGNATDFKKSGIPTDVKKQFELFVSKGVPGEMSRMYVSVNARNSIAIQDILMQKLLHDYKLNAIPLTHMDSFIASIADKKECTLTKHWLLDCDTTDASFVDSIMHLDIETALHCFNTPHGFALIAEHGFDTRLLNSIPDYQEHPEWLTIKRDAKLCVDWRRKC